MPPAIKTLMDILADISNRHPVGIRVAAVAENRPFLALAVFLLAMVTLFRHYPSFLFQLQSINLR